MRKKILAFLLTTLMVASLLPLTAFAAPTYTVTFAPATFEGQPSGYVTARFTGLTPLNAQFGITLQRELVTGPGQPSFRFATAVDGIWEVTFRVGPLADGLHRWDFMGHDIHLYGYLSVDAGAVQINGNNTTLDEANAGTVNLTVAPGLTYLQENLDEGDDGEVVVTAPNRPSVVLTAPVGLLSGNNLTLEMDYGMVVVSQATITRFATASAINAAAVRITATADDYFVELLDAAGEPIVVNIGFATPRAW